MGKFRSKYKNTLKISSEMSFKFIFQYGGEISDTLQEINLTVIDIGKCKEVCSRVFTHFKVTNNNICTFTKIGEGMCKVSI